MNDINFYHLPRHIFSTENFMQRLAPRTDLEYFWTDDWSPEFYIELAQAGFINTSFYDKEKCYLAPHLHVEIALLDWYNVRVAQSTKKILTTGQLERDQICLRISSDPRRVVAGINATYSENTWLYPPYCELLEQLTHIQHKKFKLLAVELHSLATGELIAGDLGYTIGATYTSLSGYFDRSNPRWSNFGKIQLLALARLLEKSGYQFWNLGQPHLDYKAQFGAVYTERAEFLQRWSRARSQEARVPLTHYLDQDIHCVTLI